MAYTSIRLSVLRGDQKIGFDAFVQIGEKHILYCRKGDSFEGERLNRLKAKKLKKLFIKEADEQAYREYMANNIEQAYSKSSSISLDNRAEIVQGLQQSAAEAVFEDPADQAAYQAAKEGSQKFIDFLAAEDKAVKAMLSLENSDQSLAHHGVTVAALAVEIAKVTGYKDEKNFPMMALGGLLHDIGHYISNQNISRPLKDFSPDELALYKSHPLEGANKVKDLKHMDLHVTQIISQHEECANGSGFPEGLNENKLNPLSVFIQSANIFDRMVTFEKVPATEAVKRLITPEFIGRYPLPHLNALKAIVAKI